MYMLADLLPAHKSGVGWGGAVTFTHLRTSMMWRHGTFTCTCAHTSWRKPPPESKRRMLETGAMSDIGRKDNRGKTTLLLADGAPCYKGLSKMSKGVFSVWRSVQGRGSVRVLKDGIPNFIDSTVGGKPNNVLSMYMRRQQWRWECHEKDILAETGQTLATLWTKKKACQYPTRFKTQNPVRVNDKYFFLKIRDYFASKNWPSTVTTDRFYHNRGTVKDPEGCICISMCIYLIIIYVDCLYT